MKHRIGIIVQRYGSMINGGAEVHARMIAEKLNKKYEVVVLTSRAIDYHTWEPALPLGESYENGIRIVRFDHPPRNKKKAHKINRKTRGRLWYQKLYRFFGKPKWYLRFFPNTIFKDEKGIGFLTAQGPALFDLPDYLTAEKNNFSAFIFFTYLYYPTAVGMPLVGEKSIFIPTIHDEPPIYFNCFKEIVPAPRWIFFNTKAEMIFSEHLFNIHSNKKEIVAVGIDIPTQEKDPSVLEKYKIKQPYIIYVGRIDKAKGCQILIDYFKSFINETKENLTLVMVGKSVIEEIVHPNIKYTGFVSDDEKSQLIKHSSLLVIPSFYESLSLVLLESFSHKIPVIANGKCSVLADHIHESQAGFSYTNQSEFFTFLSLMIHDKTLSTKMGTRGFDYVKKNYLWEKVLDKFDDAIQDIASQ